MNDRLSEALSRHISTVTGQPFVIQAQKALSGGCINSAYRLQGKGQVYFVKLNAAHGLPMFAAEAAGLREIAATATLKVPQPICWGEEDGWTYLVLEYLPLQQAGKDTMELLGRQLARLHQVVGPGFGWHRDNTFGSTPQINSQSQDWVDFWHRQRLGFQLDLAARNGYTGHLQRQGERLLTGLVSLFRGHAPAPVLLHGDLWSGNIGSDAEGNPVVFDPAVYYGDRETDLAMTALFGGFSPRFYSAYSEIHPLDEGYRLRWTIYNLYPILNHLNLFGRGYLAQAERMMDSLLAELG